MQTHPRGLEYHFLFSARNMQWKKLAQSTRRKQHAKVGRVFSQQAVIRINIMHSLRSGGCSPNRCPEVLASHEAKTNKGFPKKADGCSPAQKPCGIHMEKTAASTTKNWYIQDAKAHQGRNAQLPRSSNFSRPAKKFKFTYYLHCYQTLTT